MQCTGYVVVCVCLFCLAVRVCLIRCTCRTCESVWLWWYTHFGNHARRRNIFAKAQVVNQNRQELPPVVMIYPHRAKQLGKDGCTCASSLNPMRIGHRCNLERGETPSRIDVPVRGKFLSESISCHGACEQERKTVLFFFCKLFIAQASGWNAFRKNRNAIHGFKMAPAATIRTKPTCPP